MNAFSIYRRLLRFARPYAARIVVLLVASLVATPIALLTPLPLKIVVDNVIGGKPVPAFLARLLPAQLLASPCAILLFAIGILLVLSVVSQLQRMGSNVLMTYVAEKLVLRFRSELFRHMQRLSLAYHDMTGSADSLYRIQYDAMSIQFVALDGFIPFVVAIATLGSMVYVIARLDATLALVALGIMPLLVVVLRHYRRRGSPASAAWIAPPPRDGPRSLQRLALSA
jgi:ATP-binding cassette subfamily B protein